MTITDYNKIKEISHKVIDLLVKEKYSSLHDIKIIYNILMGFPYCIDCDGHYIYKGQFYNSMDELPLEGLIDLQYILQTKPV